MNKLFHFLSEAEHLRRTHGVLALTWILLGIPTVVWWKQSILWVAMMSIYVIIATHWSGWQAARAEVKVEDTNS